MRHLRVFEPCSKRGCALVLRAVLEIPQRVKTAQLVCHLLLHVLAAVHQRLAEVILEHVGVAGLSPVQRILRKLAVRIRVFQLGEVSAD